MPFTPALAAKYRDMAVLTAALSAMPVPHNFKQYEANRKLLLQMPDKYHDLWYFRAFFENERSALGISSSLPVGAKVTIAEFEKVFPDSVGYMHKLERHYLIIASAHLPPAPPE